MDRVRQRIGDKRVLSLVKAFLKAGVLGEDQVMRDTVTGTPQGGILSPLLANIALSVLDEHFMGQWESWGGTYGRSRRRAKGLANYRLVRFGRLFPRPALPNRSTVHLAHPLGNAWGNRRVKNDLREIQDSASRPKRSRSTRSSA